MAEDLNTRVENAAHGITPQTKPDERRRFLGSLRERVFLRMNNEEITDPKLTHLFLTHIRDYRGYTILINSKISNDSFLGKVEAECSKNNIPFTLVSNDTAKTGAQDSALLVVSDTAINKMRIEINQVYSPDLPPTQLTKPKKKMNFWQRLFHGDNK